MAAPNSGFQLLPKFPVDILAGIVLFVHGEDLGRFKMTGCKSFWSRLTCQNVVKSVKLGNGRLRFKSWPSFVNEFPSLESLRIESQSERWWSELGLTLNQLPFTLRSLSLIPKLCDFSCDRFFQVPTRSDTIQLNEHIPNLEVLEIWNTDATKFDWVLHCPPTLTKLHVHHWKTDVALPASLIHFQAIGTIPTAFPDAIESISCGRQRFSHSLPCLTSLSACIGNGGLVQLEDIKSLPRSLTNLDVYNTLPSVTWPSLPENLQSLSFEATNASCTEMSVSVDPFNGEIQNVESVPLERLPKSLTKLLIHSCSMFVSGYRSSLFPPHLTSFDAPNVKLAPNAAKQLPSSLKHLSTCNFYEQLCEHLPHGLTSLSFRNALLSPKTIQFLPKSLTRLNWRFSTCKTGREQWLDYTAGKTILSSLPDYLVHVDYASYFASLPPNLTFVKLHLFEELQDDFIENQGFSNLLSLTLSEMTQFSDNCIRFLNRHMIHLEVDMSPKITGKCFKSLPRCLIFLRLGSSSSIVDEDIQHLPRTLQFILIRSATELSNACIRDFPRSCKRLDIRDNQKITKLCIPDFPLSLESFIGANLSWNDGSIYF